MLSAMSQCRNFSKTGTKIVQTVKKSSQQYATRKWKNTFNIGHVRSLTILRYYDVTIFYEVLKNSF